MRSFYLIQKATDTETQAHTTCRDWDRKAGIEQWLWAAPSGVHLLMVQLSYKAYLLIKKHEFPGYQWEGNWNLPGMRTQCFSGSRQTSIWLYDPEQHSLNDLFKETENCGEVPNPFTSEPFCFHQTVVLLLLFTPYVICN